MADRQSWEAAQLRSGTESTTHTSPFATPKEDSLYVQKLFCFCSSEFSSIRWRIEPYRAPDWLYILSEYIIKKCAVLMYFKIFVSGFSLNSLFSCFIFFNSFSALSYEKGSLAVLRCIIYIQSVSCRWWLMWMTRMSGRSASTSEEFVFRRDISLVPQQLQEICLVGRSLTATH